MSTSTLLMTNPDNYLVEYEINPWMNASVLVDQPKTQAQWNALREIYRSIDLTVHEIPSEPGLPDMVFTANAGLIHQRMFFPSNFRYPQRQPERALFRTWFFERGYEVIDLPEDILFEGAGDALVCGNTLYLGYGFRSEARVRDALKHAITDLEIVSLGLANPYFYHLDTCFSPLPDGGFIYYPDAFDDASRLLLKQRGGIVVTEKFCVNYGCNMTYFGNTLITSCKDARVEALLAERGFTIINTDVSEFLKAGGGVRCLSLFI
jgi:N-dimethylarginine dimethylaminohydrolase